MTVYGDQRIYQALQESLDGGGIRISPFSPGLVNPNSYDLTLGDEILVYVDSEETAEQQEPHRVSLLDTMFRLKPGCFVLATTRERIQLGRKVCARVAGKSSRAREGLSIEFAGWVDSGWEGQITLELACHLPVMLSAGMKVGQVVFMDSTYVQYPYEVTGHYQGQTGVTESWEITR